MAGLRAEVVIESGLFVEVGFGVGALGAVAGRVGNLDKAPAVEHKARPPPVGDEPPRPVDLAEEEGGVVRSRSALWRAPLSPYFFWGVDLLLIFFLKLYFSSSIV